jgi:hypothetical protein
MRGVGHVAHMGEIRNAYKILVRKPGSYRNRMGRRGLGSCVQGNKPLGYIKGREFLN